MSLQHGAQRKATPALEDVLAGKSRGAHPVSKKIKPSPAAEALSLAPCTQPSPPAPATTAQASLTTHTGKEKGAPPGVVYSTKAPFDFKQAAAKATSHSLPPRTVPDVQTTQPSAPKPRQPLPHLTAPPSSSGLSTVLDLPPPSGMDVPLPHVTPRTHATPIHGVLRTRVACFVSSESYSAPSSCSHCARPFRPRCRVARTPGQLRRPAFHAYVWRTAW